jgi:hypothetical protein
MIFSPGVNLPVCEVSYWPVVYRGGGGPSTEFVEPLSPPKKKIPGYTTATDFHLSLRLRMSVDVPQLSYSSSCCGQDQLYLWIP